jgi:hypothetical protein
MFTRFKPDDTWRCRNYPDSRTRLTSYILDTPSHYIKVDFFLITERCRIRIMPGYDLSGLMINLVKK